MREPLSHKYIKGHGVEIGGLHYPLPVLPGVLVDYVDRAPLEEIAKDHDDVKIVQNKIIVDDAEEMKSFGINSLDFVIANHVLEHCKDTIGTLKTWSHIVRHRGIIYAAVPDMRYTFDKRRALTSLEHMNHDHKNGSRENDLQHYLEYFEKVDDIHWPALGPHAENCWKEKVNIHFHTFTLDSLKALFEKMENYFSVEELVVHGAEVICILRVK